ncbi:MAG: tetratricopeptide repeat protein, partial [Candidatus Marinimicrobia bacterium]|nr:tetratricopeptide repeat protein [Candidatus Neomarinimicrobiota bacterium]
VLVGKNMDSAEPGGRIWFVPAEQGANGAVYLGFSEDDPRSGFNSKGLFCTIVDCPHWQVKTDPAKEVLFGNLIEQIMKTCATVDDVRKLQEKYNLYDLHYAQIMVADKNGKALIIESNTVLEPVAGYLAMSNFYQSNPELGTAGQDRFELTGQFIAENGINFGNFRQALSMIRREIEQPTVYSYLYDLKKGNISLYNFHNFETAVVLNVTQELAKGERSLSIQELFGERLPYKKAYAKYMREEDIRNDLRRGDHAIAAGKIKDWFLENSGFDMHTEGSLNGLGYQLMGAGQLDGAITIFELNVELYPEASNPYDSLGEAYMNAERTEEAIINYRKSLELDPGNTNAVEMLRRLESTE